MPTVGSTQAMTIAAERFARPYEEVREHLTECLGKVQRWLERHALLFPDRYSDGKRDDVDERLEAIAADLRSIESLIESRERASERAGMTLPLLRVRRALDLGAPEMDLLVALAAAECEPDFSRAFQRSWGDSSRQGDVAFFAELVGGRGEGRIAVEEALQSSSVLARHGLVSLTQDRGWQPRTPPLFLRVKLGTRVASFFQGEFEPPPRSLPNAVSLIGADDTPRLEALVLMPGVAERVGSALAAAARGEKFFDPVCLVAPRRSGRKALVSAVSEGASLVVLDAAELPREPDPFEQVLMEALCEAVLAGGILYLDGAEALSDPEQRRLRARVAEVLAGSGVRFVLGLDGAIEPWAEVLPRLISVQLTMPDAATQLAIWSRLLPLDCKLDAACDLGAITARYSLPAGLIHRCIGDLVANARAKDPKSPTIEMSETIAVVRRQLGNRFGDLAQHVATTFTWDDLILPEDVLQRIFEVVGYARYRETILRDWGFERKLPYGRSISVLLAGEPGTGKTMVASLLARELGLELFRVNVSKVVDKYIGETEKNLGRIFEEARRGQVALLFDEADSLFSRRTEVRSSNDRYSNLAVNFLLQAVESHDGVILLTTNHEKAIDPAFRRRIRFRVTFPFPDDKDRARLWQSMIPQEAWIADKIDWLALGRDFNMTGGPIKNAVVRAALIAVTEGKAMSYEMLRRGARIEYEELGHLVAGRQQAKGRETP